MRVAKIDKRLELSKEGMKKVSWTVGQLDSWTISLKVEHRKLNVEHLSLPKIG